MYDDFYKNILTGFAPTVRTNFYVIPPQLYIVQMMYIGKSCHSWQFIVDQVGIEFRKKLRPACRNANNITMVMR